MRRYGFDLIVSVICIALLGFFGWHGLYGKRSFASQDTLLQKVSQLEEERDKIRARRESLDGRVALLRPESIDPDMLEEMARKMLGFARASELIVDN